MNKISESIIRLLCPKPKENEILVMPYIKRIKRPSGKLYSVDDSLSSEDCLQVEGCAPCEPLTGQISLDGEVVE